ncbi:TetR/AcrR family transcriptional regulator [Rothia sp. 32237D007AR]
MSDISAQETSISDAAIRVIVTQGFDVVSVRKVAQEAGLTHGTVQYYMGTKNQLLEKALLRSTARQHERVQNLQLPADPLERLTTALLELLPIGEVQREDATLWIIMGAAASTRSGLAKLYQQELAIFQDRLIQGLTAWQSTGELGIATEDLARTARLLTAFINGLTLDYLNAPSQPGLVDEIKADVRSGLRKILS